MVLGAWRIMDFMNRVRTGGMMIIYIKGFVITNLLTAPMLGLLILFYSDNFFIGYYSGLFVAAINWILVEYLKKKEKERGSCE